MFYFAYKTTNNVNGRYYLGVHQTMNVDDGYVGSGKALKRAVNKYGVESFSREIVKFFDSSEEMFTYERDVLVTQTIVDDKNSYNMTLGGLGGFKVVDVCDWKSKLKNSRKGKTPFLGYSHTPETKQKMSQSRKGKKAWNKGLPGTFTNKTHSPETKEKLSKLKTGLLVGEKNVFYGKSFVKGRKWYNDGLKTFYLYPSDPETTGLKIGRIKKITYSTK